MENNFSKYAAKKTLKTIGTVSEFLRVLKREGYKLVHKEGTIAVLGNKGTPQIGFVNDEGRNVLLRASNILWNRLLSGEQIAIMSLPIYDLGVDGIPELVIGLTGFEDFEPVPPSLSGEQMTELFTKFFV